MEPKETTKWRCTEREAAGNRLAAPRGRRCAGKPAHQLQEQACSWLQRKPWASWGHTGWTWRIWWSSGKQGEGSSAAAVIRESAKAEEIKQVRAIGEGGLPASLAGSCWECLNRRNKTKSRGGWANCESSASKKGKYLIIKLQQKVTVSPRPTKIVLTTLKTTDGMQIKWSRIMLILE